MGASFAVLFLFTSFWVGIGAVLPMFIPRNEHHSLIQTMLRVAAVCCYSMWLITYMAQMNPLIGPQVSGVTLNLIQRNWPQLD